MPASRDSGNMFGYSRLTKPLYRPIETDGENTVAVVEKILVGVIGGYRFAQLLQGPGGRGVIGDVNMCRLQ